MYRNIRRRSVEDFPIDYRKANVKVLINEALTNRRYSRKNSTYDLVRGAVYDGFKYPANPIILNFKNAWVKTKVPANAGREFEDVMQDVYEFIQENFPEQLLTRRDNMGNVYQLSQYEIMEMFFERIMLDVRKAYIRELVSEYIGENMMLENDRRYRILCDMTSKVLVKPEVSARDLYRHAYRYSHGGESSVTDEKMQRVIDSELRSISQNTNLSASGYSHWLAALIYFEIVEKAAYVADVAN